jgi:hypothetical protein
MTETFNALAMSVMLTCRALAPALPRICFLAML